MKNLLIVVVIIILIAVGYWLYQSVSSPEETSEAEATICEVDSDCIIFGQDGDCNCGCFNKNHDWEAEGDCFCAAPKACKCVDGKCEGVFDEAADYILEYSEGNCSTDSQCEYAGEGCGGGHGTCTNQPDKYEGAITICDIVYEHPINNGYKCECIEAVNKCGWSK